MRVSSLSSTVLCSGAPLHAAPNTPCPPRSCAPSLSLSLSLACSAHPQAPGTAFLRERNSARIAQDGAYVSACSPSAGTFKFKFAVNGYVTQKVVANKLGRGRIRHGYDVKVG